MTVRLAAALVALLTAAMIYQIARIDVSSDALGWVLYGGCLIEATVLGALVGWILVNYEPRK